MKILFVMQPRLDAGSIQAVANYIRAGDKEGHTVAIYGPAGEAGSRLRFSKKAGEFEHVIFIYESNLFWPKRLQLAKILSDAPRQRRVVLDADGMYNPLVVVDGYDRNYWSEEDRSEWMAHFRALSDRVLQPTLRETLHGQARPLPFYGYDPSQLLRRQNAPAKTLDIALVGHNWWRWRQISGSLLPALAKIRSRVGKIGFVGLWWDKVQKWTLGSHWEAAYRVDPGLLRQLEIEVKPAVAFQEVIPAMSSARINIMTQRPLLSYLKHLTSKYFECFCADTVPLVMIDPDLSEAVYGPAGRELTLNSGIAEKLMDVLDREQHYRQLVEEVRQHLLARHSYANRIQELAAALRLAPRAQAREEGRR